MWNELSSVVPDELLPIPERDPKLGITFREYGCGAYGCVLPTKTPGVVVKVTTDHREAFFAQYAIDLAESDGFPEGMVRYYMTVWLKELTHMNRPVYVLWREELDFLGRAALDRARNEFGSPDIERMLMHLRYFSKMSEFAFDHIHKKSVDRGSVQKHFDQYARGDIQVGYGNLVDEMDVVQGVFWKNRNEGVGLALARAWYETEQLLTTESGVLIGEALNYYMSKDVALPDTHIGNLGFTQRPNAPNGGLIITDPSNAFTLLEADLPPLVKPLELVSVREDWFAAA
jgi:hypothetical protein